MQFDVDQFLSDNKEAADKPVTWGQLATLFRNAKMMAPAEMGPIFDRLLKQTVHMMELPEDHGGAAPVSVSEETT